MVLAPNGPGKGPYGANRMTQLRADNTETQRYMEALQDTRPAACQSEDYMMGDTGNGDLSVSIIIHFNEDQYYDAKLTLHSVVQHTGRDQYKEIVILDDGSKTIQHEAAEFLNQKQFAKVKVYRTDIPGGESSSKYKASKLAQGDVLVFLSTKSVVNKGWLAPLVKAVHEKENRIATPHVDNFLAGYRFFENKHNLVNVMSLTLGTYYYETESTDKNDVSYVNNPVIRGDAFAMRKHFLHQLGDFDEGISVGGGEHLELSLRTWLCGGEINVVPCSRVVTHDALKPQTIQNAGNIRRITDLWLGTLKHIVYNQAKVKFPLHEPEDSEVAMWLRLRKSHLRNSIPGQCHDFDWYHEKIAKQLVLPNSLPRHFGYLSDRNSLCVQRKPFYEENAEILDVVHCRPHTYDPLKIIEMTAKGLLMMADRCIRVEKNGQVSVGKCMGDDSVEKWNIDPTGRMYLRENDKMCLTHTMERNRNNELVHFLTMEKCTNTREQLWNFTEY